ncbi:Golgi complex component 7-domain-containing protein [Pisolithus albus]|nr:Golgi complex component 7-domain-containing protein [Pisolithus albus]
MSTNSAYPNSDRYNRDFTDEDAFMLIRIAASPEHRLHTCQWVDNSTSCRNDISGRLFPTHLRERHGIMNADNRMMRCRWDGCRDTSRGCTRATIAGWNSPARIRATLTITSAETLGTDIWLRAVRFSVFPSAPVIFSVTWRSERVCLCFPQHWKGVGIRNEPTKANEKIATILKFAVTAHGMDTSNSANGRPSVENGVLGFGLGCYISGPPSRDRSSSAVNRADGTSVIEQLDQSPDVLTWLNAVLDSSGQEAASNDGASLDTLLTATSIAAQSTSSALENTIDDIARATPRLAYDLHFTRDGALALKSVLAQSVPSNNPSTTTPGHFDATSKVLERLQYLDTIKTRMEAARDVLREAESWGALEAEVTALLAEKSYARAASRLSASAKLMPVSRPAAATPGTAQEPRRALLTSLANQLEAAVSPDLTSGAKWKRGTEAVLDDESTPTGTSEHHRTPEKLTSFYPTFLSSFLSILNGERHSIPAIFPDPESTLAFLIHNTLTALTPSPGQRFAALFHGSTGTSALRDMVKLFQVTEEFAKGTERIMEKLRASAPSAMPAASPLSSGEGKLSRRRSMRMSMSWRSTSSISGSAKQQSGSSGISSVDAMEWDQCLFQPFLDFQVDFGTLERRLLEEALGSPVVKLQGVVDSDRAARAMREHAVDVFSAAEESIERCMTFTHGYASVGLVRALDSCVCAFVDAWTNRVIDWANAGSATGTSALSYSGAEDEEFADLDYTSQDWAYIQRALHLLAAAQAIKERLVVFETRLRGVLSQVAMAFRTAANGLYTPGVTKGEGMLLAQSTLNSVELRDLFSRVLQSQSTGTTAVAPVLLTSSHSALTSFARANQHTLQRVLLSPLFVHLNAYSSLPVWSASRQEPVPGLAGVNIPAFSLSPSETIQRVGDGLLNLPRLFEVYAEDDALGFEIGALATGDGLTSGREGDDLSAVQAEQPHSPEAVTAAWLSSLGRTMLAHLTRNILPQIRVLTSAGSAQLAADLGYLSTIIRALGVDEGDLERWRTCVSVGDEEGRADYLATEKADDILRSVAKMRGWF